MGIAFQAAFAQSKLRSNDVIPAQAGILVKFQHHFVFTDIAESQTRFPPARE